MQSANTKSLTPELVEHILSCLDPVGSTPTYRVASLISRTWVHSSQGRLFRRVSIAPLSIWLARLFFVLSRPRLLQHVTELNIVYSDQDEWMNAESAPLEVLLGALLHQISMLQFETIENADGEGVFMFFGWVMKHLSNVENFRLDVASLAGIGESGVIPRSPRLPEPSSVPHLTSLRRLIVRVPLKENSVAINTWNLLRQWSTGGARFMLCELDLGYICMYGANVWRGNISHLSDFEGLKKLTIAYLTSPSPTLWGMSGELSH
jgi:hypothetical protein